jgi:hypothetical protein
VWAAIVAVALGLMTASPSAAQTVQAADLLESEPPTRPAASVRDAGPGDVVELALVTRNISANPVAVQVMITGLTGQDEELLEGTDGLHASIQSCSIRWTEVTTATGAPSYICEGSVSTLANRASVSTLADQPLAYPGAVSPDELISLRAVVEFPNTADNSYEDLRIATVRLDVIAEGPGGDDQGGNAITGPTDGTLPFTGAQVFVTSLVGLIAIAIGFAFRHIARRRELAAT